MASNKKYWQSVEELKDSSIVETLSKNEFVEEIPTDEFLGDKKTLENSSTSRRDFLKYVGFSTAAASLAACEGPVIKSIPYVVQPEQIIPGVANFYATTIANGFDFASILIKTREGRPIKIDGNKYSKVSAGSTSAQVESSVLTLYDKQRLRAPMLSNKESSWNEVDKFVKNTMSTLSKKSYIISNSISSPSSIDVIDKFCDKYNAEHVQYDNVSYNGMLDANLEHYGKRKLPFYDFSKANVIVSFGYDFLGSSYNHNLFNKQFADRRKVDRDNREMSRLYTFESNLSLTGANSDNRIPIESNHSPLYITELWNILSQKTGKNIFAKYRPPLISYDKSKKNLIKLDILEKVAEDLVANIGESIVISSSNDKYVQLVVNMINELLGNYGKSIDVNRSYNIRNGDDNKMNGFLSDLSKGDVSSVIFMNCNPVYDSYLSTKIKDNLSKATLKISTSDRIDETSMLCDVIAPDSHFLESWNDYEPIENSFSFGQPTIKNIFDTRQVQDSLLKWSGSNENYFNY